MERCLPDNIYFRNPGVQKSLLDILYVYCKLNEDVSYRQGFHEICAVVLWVVSCDALTPEPTVNGDQDDGMLEALDADYIEHDTFSLFQCVMRSAKAWYELGSYGADGNSSIVLKSKHIHETLLAAADPDLSDHLLALDVLPQIFLMYAVKVKQCLLSRWAANEDRRWIRLLFVREFPLEELLEVWDRLFAEDPNLQLVDLMCVAMLLRVRWECIATADTLSLDLHLHSAGGGLLHSPHNIIAIPITTGPKSAVDFCRRCHLSPGQPDAPGCQTADPEILWARTNNTRATPANTTATTSTVRLAIWWQSMATSKP